MTIVTMNLLNKHYMKWIFRNTQLLDGSRITTEHGVDVDAATGLDARERRSVLWVRDVMLTAHVLCLQEVSGDMMRAIDALGTFGTAWHWHMDGDVVKNCEGLVWNKDWITDTVIECKVKGVLMKAVYANRDPFVLVTQHAEFYKEDARAEAIEGRIEEDIRRFSIHEGSDLPLIYAGDLNFSLEKLPVRLRTTCGRMLPTNSDITHVSGQTEIRTGVPISLHDKLTKFDYILVSKGAERKWWSSWRRLDIDSMDCDKTISSTFHAMMDLKMGRPVSAVTAADGDDDVDDMSVEGDGEDDMSVDDGDDVDDVDDMSVEGDGDDW